MKKVIGVAVAASLLAGMAFADVAVSLNARLRSNMYHTVKEDADADAKKWMFDLDKSNYNATKHAGANSMSDTLAFKAKTDYAGVNLELAPNADNTAPKVDGTYNGFIKFGALKFTYGTLNSRYVDRYNTTAGESGLLDSDYTKYGVVSDEDAVLTKDANNFSTINGDKVVSLIADYTVDMGDGTLLLKGGLLSNEYKANDDQTSFQNAGYAFEGDFENDAIKLQALLKLPKDKVTVFGVFADVKSLPLPLALGFSYGSDGDDENGNFKHTEMAFDARIGYQFNDQTKLSSTIKYESVKPDSGDTETALSVVAEVSYIVSDMTTVFADLGYYNFDLDGNTDDGNTLISFRPGAVFTAGKGATVTAALQYDKYTTDDNSKQSEMSIPVIFRVKL